MATLATKI